MLHKNVLAYLGLFTLLAGDAVRNTFTWAGWGIICGLMTILLVIWFVKNKPIATIKQTPWPLTALLAMMALSTIWSNYQAVTAGVFVMQLVQTAVGVFLAAAFSWRELLRVLSNVVRFVLGASLLFELYAALIVRGPIDPVVKFYKGDKPPAPDYYWTRGNLFNGGRIQGIVGNANILAYVALLGLILFFIELTIRSVHKWVSILGLALAAGALLDAWSMTVNMALAAVVLAAVVSIAAEGKDKKTRHRYYKTTLWTIGGLALIVLAFRAEIFGFMGKTPDISGRTKIWKIVLELIDQRPLQGWGWTSYWVPFVEPYKGLIVMHGVPYLQAHNAFLDVWLQLGILGLALFVGLVGYTFVPLWRLAVRHTSPLYLWPILVFVGMLVQNLTESRMLIEIGWVLLVLFAVKVHDPKKTLEPKKDGLKRARLLSVDPRQSQSPQRKDR